MGLEWTLHRQEIKENLAITTPWEYIWHLATHPPKDNFLQAAKDHALILSGVGLFGAGITYDVFKQSPPPPPQKRTDFDSTPRTRAALSEQVTLEHCTNIPPIVKNNANPPDMPSKIQNPLDPDSRSTLPLKQHAPPEIITTPIDEPKKPAPEKPLDDHVPAQQLDSITASQNSTPPQKDSTPTQIPGTAFEQLPAIVQNVSTPTPNVAEPHLNPDLSEQKSKPETPQKNIIPSVLPIEVEQNEVEQNLVTEIVQEPSGIIEQDKDQPQAPCPTDGSIQQTIMHTSPILLPTEPKIAAQQPIQTTEYHPEKLLDPAQKPEEGTQRLGMLMAQAFEAVLAAREEARSIPSPIQNVVPEIIIIPATEQQPEKPLEVAGAIDIMPKKIDILLPISAAEYPNIPDTIEPEKVTVPPLVLPIEQTREIIPAKKEKDSDPSENNAESDVSTGTENSTESLSSSTEGDDPKDATIKNSAGRLVKIHTDVIAHLEDSAKNFEEFRITINPPSPHEGKNSEAESESEDESTTSSPESKSDSEPEEIHTREKTLVELAQLDQLIDNLTPRSIHDLVRARLEPAGHGLQNTRPEKKSMEDFFVIEANINKTYNLQNMPYQAFYAVFDGHGGDETAKLLANNFLTYLVSMRSFCTDLKNAFYEACIGFDTKILFDALSKVTTRSDIWSELGTGSTATFVFRRGTTLYMGNVGDSRVIILDKQGRTRFVSADHTPETERKHIESCGEQVKNGRIVGKNRAGIIPPLDLGVGRAFNDFIYQRAIAEEKHFDHGAKRQGFLNNINQYVGENKLISSIPDIYTYELTGDESFLVIASDGLWNFLDNEILEGEKSEVFKVISDCFDKDSQCTLKKIAKQLTNKAHIEGSDDDITVVVVQLWDPEEKQKL